MSVLGRQLDDYRRLRRLLGHDLAEAARLLPRFVDQLDATDTEFVTIAAALAWSLERDTPPGSTVPGHRMMAVRGFARYLAGIDSRTEVPPAGLIPIPRQWRLPFIYTDANVLALMHQVRRSIPQPLRAATHETLVGLLAATGLRVGEALRLDRGDIGVSDGVLLVSRSKFGKSRHVPLQPSTLDALERDAHRRRRLYPHPSTDSFFVSLRGTSVIYETVWPTFRTLRDNAAVGAGSTVTPRTITTSGTRSPSAHCLIGIATASTSRHGSRRCRPTSGIANLDTRIRFLLTGRRLLLPIRGTNET